MEKQKMNHLEKPEGWSHETSGEGYPLLLYLEEDGKGVDWNQEKYPCFFWQVTVNQGTEHICKMDFSLHPCHRHHTVSGK